MTVVALEETPTPVEQQADGSWLVGGVRYWVLDGPGPDPAARYLDVPGPEPLTAGEVPAEPSTRPASGRDRGPGSSA